MPPGLDPWSAHSSLDDLPQGALIHLRGCGEDGRYFVSRLAHGNGHSTLQFIRDETVLRPSTRSRDQATPPPPAKDS